MKRRIALLLSAMILLALPAGVSLADDASDSVIVIEDEPAIISETELESAAAEQPETKSDTAVVNETEDTFVSSIEEVEDPIDEPAAVSLLLDGTCGENLTWTLDSDFTLTISGTGAMYDYGGYDSEDGWTSNVPWLNIGVSSVIIEDGITHIGRFTFAHMNVLTNIVIPESVTSIGEGAFLQCSLSEIDLPDKLETIGDYAFSGSELLKCSIPASVNSIGDCAFMGCESLDCVVINNAAVSIGQKAFGYAGEVVYKQTGYSASTDIYDMQSIQPEIADRNYGTGTFELTIYGHSGSTAETYAAKSGDFTFVLLDGNTAALAEGKITSLTNTSTGIKIKWTAISAADGYYIYRKNSSGSYKKIKTITNASTVSYTDKKVADKNGKTYTYMVVPYAGSTKGLGTAVATVRLTGTTLTSVKNSAAGKAKVKWTKVSKVTGYQIQYSTSKTFASGNKTKKVSGASSISKTLSSLKKGKTYYVRIRTYKTVNGKTYYSAWSSKLKVKIAK